MGTKSNLELEELAFASTPTQQMAASCCGALITSLFMTPLDVIKIRMQAQQKPISNKCFLFCNGLMEHLCPCNPPSGPRINPSKSFNGTVDAFIKISKAEGLSTLWSGLAPTLVLAVPATVVYFVLYEQLKVKLMSTEIKTYFLSKDVNETPGWVPLLAGSSARVISAMCVSPLELVRTKMQSKKLSYDELRMALQHLLQNQGPKGLWKGLGATLLRDVPFSAIYWTTYENYKRIWCSPDSPPYFYFVGGAIAGCLSALFTVPFDVVKTHQQIDIGEKEIYSQKPQPSANTFTIIRSIYDQKGVKGMFAGLTPRLVKVVPACAIMIGSFEYGKLFFMNYNRRNTLLLNSDDQDVNIPPITTN